MPIPFARMEIIKRSANKTVCQSAAYNARCRIHFQGNCVLQERTFDWSSDKPPIYHEILLPEHVDEKFKNPEILWNAAEFKEKRKDSQVGINFVLALPDDKEITLEDKIHLAKTFVNENFVKKGLAVQIDIHEPSTTEGEGNQHSNWHAHILATTRRFKENGQEYEDQKARDWMPDVRLGMVTAGNDWGKLWAEHQNLFFESKGFALRVDPSGVIAQNHLGPVRLRGRAFSLLSENDARITLNQIESENPENVLKKMTETKNIFSKEDVDGFIQKHVVFGSIASVKEKFWKQKNIVQLYDKEKKKPVNLFTTKEILEEEKSAMRIADKIQSKNAFLLKNESFIEASSEKLTKEQKKAFENIIHGNRLSCIEGHAGTGKSFLLVSLKEVYEKNGYSVKAFSPDNATSKEMKGKGFSYSENIYRFLFLNKNSKVEIKKGKEVWFLDESGKLGTRPLLELLKAAETHNAQLVLSGCSSQLPSVDRGGMFKEFCQKYGAEELLEIQRQKDVNQREIATKLATGNVGAAIDQLSATGGINWSVTRECAIENLIKKWGVDQAAFPNKSSLIIAHSNREVKVLNEMVRIYLKEKKEISEKEYLCETVYGNLYVSVGDRIVFKKNDKLLGVTNGMSGVLVSASEDEFIVSIKEEKKQREVIFDPKNYTNFKLGYATTFYSSQGKTVDRAYVLFSHQINKEAFYVGLTRHVRKSHLFVSRTETRCLSELKRQACRGSQKQLTLAYTTKFEIESQERAENRQNQIKAMKESDSILTRMSGHGLSTWEVICSSSKKIVEKFKDLQPNHDFFNPDLRNQDKTDASVIEINEENDNISFEKDYKTNPQKAAKEILEKSDLISSQLDLLDSENEFKKSSYQSIGDHSKKIVDDYYESVDKASHFYTNAKSETNGEVDIRSNTKNILDLKKACSKRNELAYAITKFIPEKASSEIFGKYGWGFLKEKANIHEKSIQNLKEISNLNEALTKNFDFLLYRLFPEGHTGRDKNSLKFKPNGSLIVVWRGEKIGCFYDCEKKEGGGPFSLIKKTLGYDHSEAKKWAKDFLESLKNIKVHSEDFFKRYSLGKDKEWFTLQPTQNTSAPSLDLILGKLSSCYTDSIKYTYRNEDGTPIFHMFHLTGKNNPTKKIVIPISYGHWRGEKHKPQWFLKHYQTEKYPLYNLNLLKENPQGTVLIVENEKTADAATKMLAKDNIVCVTWLGGSSSISKVDWTSLSHRRVVVWPVNDSDGYKISDDICSELRKVCVQSLDVVDHNFLSKTFPEKWDLAEPIPQGNNEDIIRFLLAHTDEKGVDEHKIFTKLKSYENGFDRIEKMRANEILWRVEERLRPLNEKFGSRNLGVRTLISDEVLRILSGKEEFEEKFKLKLSNGLAKTVAYQVVLYEAKTGIVPSEAVIEEIKQTTTNVIGNDRILGDRVVDYALDKAISIVIETGFKDPKFQKQLFRFVYKKEYERVIKIEELPLLFSKCKSSSVDLVDDQKINPLEKLDQPQTEPQKIQKESEIASKTTTEIIKSDKLKPTPQVKPVKNQTSNRQKQEATKNTTLKNLDKSENLLLQEYFTSAKRASSLYVLVKSEADDGIERFGKSDVSLECKKEFFKRNEQAYKLIQSVSKETLFSILGKNDFDVLKERSSRYEKVIQNQKQTNNQIDLNVELTKNLESLLYRLFPDGPTSKNRRGMRFGSNGSLAVECHGDRKGSFYSFKDQEGGGPLILIQKTLGLDRTEAKKWAEDFLGVPRDFKVPSHCSFKSYSSEKDLDWQTLKPNQKIAAPSLDQISRNLSAGYTESMRHVYKDEDGNTLFYILRLVDKRDPTKKVIRPLSYGCWKDGKEKPQWYLKAYQSNKKPLYNLNLLKEKPFAKVLIVEGEKTADAASKMFSKDDVICLTWSCGASAYSKTDWSFLHQKQVIIWPDNDNAGYEAANGISSELRKIGVKSLKVVDRDLLSKEFPVKWDLADPLPQGKTNDFICELLLNAKEKSVGIDQMIIKPDHSKKCNDIVEKFRTNEILWRVEERLRPVLEEKHGSRNWEIRESILNETSRILIEKDITEKNFKTKFSEEIAKTLSYQAALYQAKTGAVPTESVLDDMKKMMVNIGAKKDVSVKFEHLSLERDLKNFVFDKSLSRIVETGISCSKSQVKFIESVYKEEYERTTKTVKFLEKSLEAEKFFEKEFQKQKNMQLDISV